VQTYHFPPQITRGESLIQEVLSEQFSLPAAEDRFQRRMIEDALRQCNGNRTQAAKMLGINRRSLYERMRRLDIRIPSRSAKA
jgi:DNA-binding NtrC family response regulator